MIKMTVKLKGLSRIIARFSKIGEVISGNVERSLSNVGFLIQRESRKRAPYRDGDLERSISFKTGRNYVDVMVPANSAAGRYAKIMHDGEYNLGKKSELKGGGVGRLYIKRAINDNVQQIREQFRTVFRGI